MRWIPVMLTFVACKAQVADTDHPYLGDDTAAGDDTATGDDTAAGDDTGGGDTSMPANPSPFTLHISGPTDVDLVFDSPTCTQPIGSSNFSQFWRNSEGAHVFVLSFQLLGTFTGAGSYDVASSGARIRLQEEAGGTGYYFFNDTGDDVTGTIDYIDEDHAWGEFSFTGLHDSSGVTVSVSPMPIPIWCPTLN